MDFSLGRPENPRWYPYAVLLTFYPEGPRMEQRKDKRFEEENDVFIKDKARALRNLPEGGVAAHTHDISVTGAWICCPQDFPIGYVIRVFIDLDGTDCLDVDGEVIWSRKSEDGLSFDIGVEFQHDLPDTVLALIRHFYAKKVALPSIVS
jgi:PilZ domain